MLKQLKYFQSVVRRNSFSEAAEENFISQSAISQQVQALERELGFNCWSGKTAALPWRLPSGRFCIGTISPEGPLCRS